MATPHRSHAAVPASASRVETTHLVMPGHANVHGTAFGGTIMQWTDLAAVAGRLPPRPARRW